MPDREPPVSAVEGAHLVFRLGDPDHTFTGVRLWQDLGLPAHQVGFASGDDGWELRLPRPGVHRVEYLFETTTADGSTTSRLDPTNPLVASGPFGDRSWLAMPEYVGPGWVDVEPTGSPPAELTVEPTPVGDVEVQVWSPADSGPDECLPLLVSHDGPELAAHAGLTRYAGAMVEQRRLPRMRLALVRPGERNLWYSANDDYATALVDHLLPAVRDGFATDGAPVQMGVSLGALSALHAEWTRPGSFAALLLQSGSFFTHDTDPQESDFGYFAEVAGFVTRVLRSAAPPSRPRVAMTAGSMEENVHNNRVMSAHLAEIGLEVDYGEAPDLHNFTAWRDLLDPYLTRLLLQVWGHVDAA